MEKKLTNISDEFFVKDLLEPAFRQLVHSLFPKFIITNEMQCYSLDAHYLLGGGCRITYVLYDRGFNSDPSKRILIDSCDKDYRIAIYNILYQLKPIDHLEVTREYCEAWLKQQPYCPPPSHDKVNQH